MSLIRIIWALMPQRVCGVRARVILPRVYIYIYACTNWIGLIHIYAYITHTPWWPEGPEHVGALGQDNNRDHLQPAVSSSSSSCSTHIHACVARRRGLGYQHPVHSGQSRTIFANCEASALLCVCVYNTEFTTLFQRVLNFDKIYTIDIIIKFRTENSYGSTFV